MQLEQLLALLADNNIKVGLDGEQLKIRAAKGALTNEIKQALSANKSQLLAWLQQQAQQQEQLTPIPQRSDHAAPCALSFAQQRLHFIHQLEPNSASYNIPAAVKIRGQLDLTALQQAINTIVARHDSLRTRFVSHNNETLQQVQAHVGYELELEDYQGASQAEVEQAIAQLAGHIFDLSQAPLLASKLMQTGADEYILVFCLHHIITDGWSTGVLLQELTALYQAYQQGQANPLPALAIQYPDFSLWQRDKLSGAQLQQQIQYWQQTLADIEPIELATDFARPAIKSQQGTSINYRFNSQLSQRLSDYAKQQGVTLFSVLMAGFKTLLHRYSQSEDICVGTPMANRNRVELEPLIGFFVNTLALRSEVKGEHNFAQQVAIEHETLLAGSRYQDAPFEQVIEALKLERNPSHTPIFQHLLVLQNSPADSTNIAGLSFEQLSAKTQTSKFDLSFNCLEVAAQGGQDAYLDLNIEYDTQLFKSQRIEAMAQHFEQLLEQATTHDQQTLQSLNLLNEAEQQQLLAWGQIQTQYPRQANLAELFADTVTTYSQHTAWVMGEQTLTYQALDQQANQLAHVLRQQGIKPGDKVALCFNRSLNCVLSILAIIKNHGVYVPLDPDYPDERLSFMLSDTQAKLILSQSEFAQRLTQLEQTPPLLLLEQLELTQQSSQFELEPAPCSSQQQLAYIMYTSGSTGTPKGVMVPHRGIVRLVRNSNYIKLDDTDALAFISNVSFDAATFEIWGALLNGGRLVGVDKQTLLTPLAFKQTLVAERVSAMFITVTLFNQYISDDIHFFDSVKNVSVGGEALDINKIRQVLASAKQANAPLQLFNGYGPTENTTFTCSWHIKQLDEQQTSVPLGYPLANSTAYILDPQQKLVPAGVAGELYSGGDGVALGYLNRADLSLESFIDDPFSQEPGAKLYRTGDLVRWLDNGQIEMLGRADDQVKIRGYRIELGEIEAALGSLAGVDKCAVLVGQQEPSDDAQSQSGSQSASQYLAAYVVINKGGELSHIREQMAANLPQYMQPQAYIVIHSLPLTANGKLDKRALPKPQTSDFIQQQYIAPSSETEKRLVSLWQKMLDLEQIGIEDNFFELGGHSLMATRLLSQIKQEFDAEVPLKELFEQPTIAHLAQLLEGEQQHSIQIPVLEASAYPQGYPLSYAQQRLWIIDQLQPGSPMYNIPLALRLRGNLDKARLQQAFKQLVQRHAGLRTSFVSLDDGAGNQNTYQQAHAESQIELPCFTLANDTELLKQRIGAFMMAEFDLQTGPLLRAQLIELEGQSDEAILLICQHHIISDGWSLQLLVQELLALYQGQHLAPMALQYHDFAVWQKDWLEQGVMQQELSYWQQKLEHSEILELPTDSPRPHLPSAQGQQYQFQLSAQLTQQLQRFSQQHGSTLYMTLLGAWQLLLARSSNQDDISIGSPVANRTQAQTEGLLGFFVNTLVMRSQINYQHSFSELLQQVKQSCLEAYSHQNVPFEHLVDNLQTSRELSQTPLFQAMFMLQNLAQGSQAVEHIEIDGLSISALESDEQSENHTPCAAKFDLSLALTETAAGLSGSLEYRSPLFSSQRIENLIADFEFLLEQLLAQPQQAMGEISLLRPQQQSQLQQWSQNPQPFKPECLQQKIERQVELSPDAIACIDKQGELSYRQLNADANRLAHYLRQQGVSTNTNVGICLGANNQALTAILAVIKAGAAYVPMDTGYPAERLIHMADNAQMQLVICDQQQSQLLDGQTLLDINQAQLWQDCSSSNPELINQVDDRLYMIFTSGSTGLPKAAAVSHANEANLLDWYVAEHGFNSQDKTLIISALGFDLSQKNLFALLTLGATVVFSQAQRYDPQSISQQIQQQQISLINCAPSAFYPLIEDPANWPALTSLRCILFGGEAIQLALLKPWLEQSQCQLINMYGPTECCDIAASYRCEATDLEHKQLPIGRPNANVELHVLTPDYLSPAPIGAAGELCIAGLGVGLGYFNNAELNQQSFVANPFGEGRLYRTGDLVRYNQQGQLEFISRIDGQVKIRGFRIELAEIEAQLQAQVGIKDAVVAAKTASNGQQLLAAFVILEASSELNSQQYRQQLKQLLPDYMVPSAYVAIEAIPLTPNGKIDRKKLHLPANADFGQRQYVAPSTATEQTLAELWQEVLQLQQIGANDDFFEAGGHSLLATKLVSRSKHQFNIELSLSNIFEYPVLSELAAYIDTLLWAQSSQAESVDEDDEDREEFEF